MTTLTSRLATGLGLLLFVSGILLLAMGIPTRKGVGYELVFGLDSAVPGWAFMLSFIGGPILVLGGSVIGMRYGHFERYHKDYNPETGTIDSNHPFARLQERVSTPDDTADADSDHPDKFVMNRTHLAGLTTVLVGGPLVYLYFVLDLSPMLQWMVVPVLGGGGVVTFFLTDRILQEEGTDSYDPSW